MVVFSDNVYSYRISEKELNNIKQQKTYKTEILNGDTIRYYINKECTEFVEYPYPIMI